MIGCIRSPIFFLGPASLDSWLYGHARSRRWDDGTAGDAVVVFISATVALSAYQHNTGAAATCEAPDAPWRECERVWSYAVRLTRLGLTSCLGHHAERTYSLKRAAGAATAYTASLSSSPRRSPLVLDTPCWPVAVMLREACVD